MFLYSLIAGSIEGSIDIMAKVIPFVLKVIFVIVVVIPVFLFVLMIDLIRQFICYAKNEEYTPPAHEPATLKDLLPKPKQKPVKVKVVKQETKKKRGGITIEEMLLYDIIDDD